MLRRPKGFALLVCTCSSPRWPLYTIKKGSRVERVIEAATGEWHVRNLTWDDAKERVSGNCPNCNEYFEIRLEFSSERWRQAWEEQAQWAVKVYSDYRRVPYASNIVEDQVKTAEEAIFLEILVHDPDSLHIKSTRGRVRAYSADDFSKFYSHLRPQV